MANCNVSRHDVAAFMALMNVLKVNLETLNQKPEVYRTLLAVLADYNPTTAGNKENTMRYIRLLLADEDLAKLLIMYLPEQIKTEFNGSPTKHQAAKVYSRTSQGHLVQKLKVKQQLKRRKSMYKPYYAKRLISQNNSSNQMVTPEIESAASSLLEMSSNAAARIQSKGTAPTMHSTIHVSSSSETADNLTVPGNDCTNLPVRTKCSTALTWTQSNTSTVKPESISLSAMEQLLLKAETKSQARSALPSLVPSGTDTEAELNKTSSYLHNYAHLPSIRKESIDLVKSRPDQSSVGNTDTPANCSVNFSPVSSSLRYNVASLQNPYQPQTVQNYCQNLYQGVNLYQSPVTPQLQGQQFSFIQPLLQQHVSGLSYHMPSAPYVHYPTGYQPTISGQTPSWSYIPSLENQYPINLSLQNQTQSTLTQNRSKPSKSLYSSKSKSSLSDIGDRQTFRKEETQSPADHSLDKNIISFSDLVLDVSNKIKQEPSSNGGSLADAIVDTATSGSQSLISKTDTSQPVTGAESVNSVPNVKSNLQALSDLTLGVGQDTSFKESRIFLGADVKSTNMLQRQVSDQMSPTGNVLTDKLSSQSCDKIPHLIVDETNDAKILPVTLAGAACSASNRSGETIYIDRNRRRLSLTSFPYSQEIKLPDGHLSLIKLQGDQVSMKNIDRMQEITHVCSPGTLNGNVINKNISAVQGQGSGKTVKELLQLQNLNGRPVTPKQQTLTKEVSSIKPVLEAEKIVTDTSVNRLGKKTLPAKNYNGQKVEYEAHNNQEKQKNLYKLADDNDSRENVASEKLNKQSSNITVEISQVDRLDSGNDMEIVKQRSKSDSNCPSGLNVENVVSVGKTTKNVRKKNLQSDGDLPGVIFQGNLNSQKFQSSSDMVAAKDTDDMVHVVGSNKLVTVKVSKYPGLNIPNKSLDKTSPVCKHTLSASPEPSGDAKKDSRWIQSPLHIKIGKTPVIKSRPPQEFTSLSAEERQYLEQIQNFPKNQYQNSSLAQLLMKDFKIAGNVQNQFKMNSNKPASSESIDPILPEQFVGHQFNQHSSSQPRRTQSDSSVVHQGASNINSFGENSKSTNTSQNEDDEVFLEDLPLSHLKKAVLLNNNAHSDQTSVM